MTVSQLIHLLQQAPDPEKTVICDLTSVTDDPQQAGLPVLGLHIDDRDNDIWLVTNTRAQLHITL